jgi:beta-fructofuranosidase
VTELRDIEVMPEGKLPPACEMEIDVPDGDFDLNLFTKADGSGGMRIHYDSAKKVCTVDRTGMDKRFNENVGEVLDMPVVTPLKKLRIFIDRSSTEIFVNDGEATFTTHSYPTDDEFNYTVTDGANIKMWTMKRSVTDRFVV